MHPHFAIVRYRDLRGLNEALERQFLSEAEAVVALREDIELEEPSLSALHSAHEQRPDALLGCRLADNRWPGHFRLPGRYWSQANHEWRPESYFEIKRDPHASTLLDCDRLNPECMLITKAAWHAVGGFDTTISAAMSCIDWGLRAGRQGFSCYEVQAALVHMDFAPSAQRGPWGPSHLPDFPGMLRLAQKYRLPTRRAPLVYRFLLKALSEETRRVSFWADYGRPISLFKRSFWYLRNLFLAFQRAQIPTLLRYASIHLLCPADPK